MKFRSVTLLVLGLLVSAGVGVSPAAAADAPTVTVADGPLMGATADGVDRFLGIPYAAPPVGDLRWRAPAAPAQWTTPRDASHHATRCSAPAAGDGVRLINEDCLYLDVYRPAGAAADAKLPVIVYFHGGGGFSGSTDIYDGGRAAAVGKSVIVMPAYRLGALGFMATAELGKEDARAEGAYGILDQIQALKWVATNISAFGGDPADVTLTGQSAGGYEVCDLMAIASTKGLYKQAIIQSGPCQVNPSLADAEKHGGDIGTKVGCADLACLRKLPADALVDAWADAVTDSPFGTPLMPKTPLEAFASGEFVRVPTLVGFARNEMWGFMHDMYPLDEASYEKIVKGQFGDAAEQVLARYPAASFPHNEYAFGALQGDSFFVCPSFAAADRLSKFVPVSMYEFADATAPNWKSLGTDETTPPGYEVGPGHTSELFYLYDYQAISRPLDADQIALGNKMIGMWVDFGRTSDAAEWPAYTATDRKVVEIKAASNGGLTTSTEPFTRHNCDFWSK